MNQLLKLFKKHLKRPCPLYTEAFASESYTVRLFVKKGIIDSWQIVLRSGNIVNAQSDVELYCLYMAYVKYHP